MSPLAVLLLAAALAQPPEAPWMAVTHTANGYALVDLSTASAEPVVALVDPSLRPGRVRADPQGAKPITAHAPHTVADAQHLWQLVPVSSRTAPFWTDAQQGLAIVRTDLATGASRTQVIALQSPVVLRWAGDLNRDGEPDWVFDNEGGQLWMSGPDGWSPHTGPLVVSNDAEPAEGV